MRAGEVQLEGIHARVLTALDDLDPGVLAIFLHHAGDENAVWELALALLELLDPMPERPVADELDVLPPDDLAARRQQLRVARGDVDDLGGVKADGLGDDGPPAFLKRLGDDVEICAGRAGADDKGIGELESVNGSSLMRRSG